MLECRKGIIYSVAHATWLRYCYRGRQHTARYRWTPYYDGAEMDCLAGKERATKSSLDLEAKKCILTIDFVISLIFSSNILIMTNNENH